MFYVLQWFRCFGNGPLQPFNPFNPSKHSGKSSSRPQTAMYNHLNIVVFCFDVTLEVINIFWNRATGIFRYTRMIARFSRLASLNLVMEIFKAFQISRCFDPCLSNITMFERVGNGREIGLNPVKPFHIVTS